MANTITRVVKVGGSLFDLPDLGACIQAWLRQEKTAKNIFVAGGGELAEFIRRQHQLSPLDESRAHWLCIEAMQMMSHILHQRLLGSVLCQHLSEMRKAKARLNIARLGESFYILQHPPGNSEIMLHESWEVTSDSIAARLAICLGADELVLLKSADPPTGDLQELSDLGYIDKFFPKLADELPPWRMVNLRSFTGDASHRG